MLEGPEGGNDMVVIGFVLLGAGLLIGVLLALTDPVMLSRVNGEPAQGASGRHIGRHIGRSTGEGTGEGVVRLPRREVDGREERTAA